MENLVVKFEKPYLFEGIEYTEVDLSGISNLRTVDLIEADKEFNTSGQFSVMNEMATGYICILASKATGLPVEFFEQLPIKEGLKIKHVVFPFLNE